MSPRTVLWLVAGLFLAVLGLRLYAFAHRDPAAALRREAGAYQEVRATILDKYVEQVDERKLFYGALEGMAAKLDPHSVFWPPQRYKVEQTATTGHFGGLGMTLYLDKQKNLILVPMPNSPAARAGLWPFDRFLKIEGQPIEQMNLEEAGERIRGEPGTSVRLTVARRGRSEPLDVTVERAEIKVESVPEALVLTPPTAAAARIPAGAPRLGYVQLTKFQEDSATDLDAALKDLEAQGLVGLILDLRGNTGGLLHTALEVCDLFLSSGTIVMVRDRETQTGPPRETYQARATAADRTYPLALLVDGSSASASEIVAGCLKDHGRALLVGEKTYGKGSVQSIIPLDLDDWGRAALKLTTAKFYTPKGRVIDGKGVEPDYLVPFTAEQLDGLLRERLRRQLARDPALGAALSGQDAAAWEQIFRGDKPGEKAAEPFHDTQLEKAVEVLTKALGASR